MPKIIPIVEGDGDISAVPILIRRLLAEYFNEYSWDVGTPKRAHSLPAFRKKLGQFIQYAQSESDCGAILILLDLDDGCPKEQAQQLAIDIQKEYRQCPILIVLAHREYESWFLSSAEMLAGKYSLSVDLVAPDNPEHLRDAKGWLTKNMPAGLIYKETTHQPAMTNLIDFDLTMERSRSFRRLVHALEQLLNADVGTAFVSPFV